MRSEQIERGDHVLGHSRLFVGPLPNRKRLTFRESLVHSIGELMNRNQRSPAAKDEPELTVDSQPAIKK